MFLERMMEAVARKVFWEQADSYYTRQVRSIARVAAEDTVQKASISLRMSSLKATIRVTLDDGAYLPVRAHDTDAGADLRCREWFMVPAHSSCVIDTGVHVELPAGTVGMLKSKSGLNVKSRLVTEGVIDEGYTGPIKVCVYNHGEYPYEFNAGDKVTQLVVVPVVYPDYIESDEITGGDRGSAGFGSTGQ